MNEEKVKKYSKDGMICCGIITIISIVGFIFITIFDRNISDIAVFGVIFVLLIVTCVYGFVKFYKQFNNPNNKKVNNNTNTYRGYLYNSEWNWDIAEANYRIQYNKKDTDINEKDEEIIWKYCCTEIAFYLAWLVENEFLTLDLVINETIEKVKKRQTMPDDLFECIDLKLSEEDVSDKILPFIDYCLNDGFESIDNFYNKVSQKYANVFADKYGVRDSRRCGFTFKWDDCDEFKKILDKEYKDYLSV